MYNLKKTLSFFSHSFHMRNLFVVIYFFRTYMVHIWYCILYTCTACVLAQLNYVLGKKQLVPHRKTMGFPQNYVLYIQVDLFRERTGYM